MLSPVLIVSLVISIASVIVSMGCMIYSIITALGGFSVKISYCEEKTDYFRRADYEMLSYLEVIDLPNGTEVVRYDTRTMKRKKLLIGKNKISESSRFRYFKKI